MQNKEISMGEIIDYIVQNVEEKGVSPRCSLENKMYRIGDNLVMLTVTCDKKGVPLKAACNKGRQIFFFNQEQAKYLNDACEKKVKAQEGEHTKLAEYQKQKEALEKEKQRIASFERRHDVIMVR